jgi:hypothetical protein
MTQWTLPTALPLLDERFPLPVDRPFTLRQADEAGVPAHRLRRLARGGYVRRVLKGVYVATQVPDGRRLRGQALALVVPHTGVVTDWCACWLWTGIDAPGDHLEVPPLTVFHRHRHTRFGNTISQGGSRSFRPSDITQVHGFNVTTPLRTAWDIGRLQHRDRAIGGLDALLRLGAFTPEELVEGVERFKGMREVRQLRHLAPLADGRAESPGESVLRLRWLDLPSLPPPTPQVPVMVNGVEVYRLDLAVPELCYGCEYDGRDFHTDRARDDVRREDLRVRFGWHVDGVRQENVFGVRRDVEEILQRGIDEARRATGRPTYVT